jgi:beta-glucosidase
MTTYDIFPGADGPEPQAPQRADFGPDFLWGCATSSYQIEGAGTVDGRVESIWDRFAATPGKIRDGSSGVNACDHYHRWPQDLDIGRDLGLNAYRFSIAWPRIFDGRSREPNAKGLDFYDRLVDGMLERGLQPWATLYHWDLPQWLQDRGGWASRDTVDAFVDLADAVTRRLGDRVGHWITHNEPWCTAIIGNYEGWHAPGLTDLGTALQVAHHVLLSHGRAVPVIRANVPGAQVGISLSLHPLRPASPAPEDVAAMERHDGLRYRWFLDPLYGRGYPEATLAQVGAAAPVVLPGDLDDIAVPTDFLGVNYYFPETVAHDPDHGPLGARVLPAQGEITAMGWPVAPQGLSELLARVDRVMLRRRGNGRRECPRRGAAPLPDASPGRAAPGRGRRRAGERLFRVEPAGQFRVGGRLSAPLRPRARGLRHAAASPEGQREMVSHVPARGLNASG